MSLLVQFIFFKNVFFVIFDGKIRNMCKMVERTSCSKMRLVCLMQKSIAKNVYLFFWDIEVHIFPFVIPQARIFPLILNSLNDTLWSHGVLTLVLHAKTLNYYVDTKNYYCFWCELKLLAQEKKDLFLRWSEWPVKTRWFCRWYSSNLRTYSGVRCVLMCLRRSGK